MSNRIEEQINEILDPDDKDWGKTIQSAGWVIYYLGIVFASAHIFSWVGKTLSGFFLIMGYIGAVGIAGNAIVLPKAIKEWTFDKTHRGAAITFYVIDFILMAGFVWANINSTSGAVVQLATEWMIWVAPITFMNSILTWAVLFILDPAGIQRYLLRREIEKASIIKIRAQAAAQVIEARQEAAKLLENVGVTQPEHQKKQTRIPEPSFMPEFAPPEYWPEDLPEEPIYSGNNSHHPKV